MTVNFAQLADALRIHYEGDVTLAAARRNLFELRLKAHGRRLFGKYPDVRAVKRTSLKPASQAVEPDALERLNGIPRGGVRGEKYPTFGVGSPFPRGPLPLGLVAA